MYEKLNITENHLQALSLFTKGYDNDFYIREVERLLKISPRTAQLILSDLENKGILESKMRGKIRAYTLKKDSLSQMYILLAEHYKKVAFLEKNLMIREIIEKIVPHIKGIGIIFGSYAKGSADKGSDLDIFVAGEFNKRKIKEVSERYGIEVSVKCYPIKTFEKCLENDVLVKEILMNHIIFLNIELFIDLVAKKWKK